MNAADIVGYLREMYSDEKQWLFFAELQVETGGGSQRLDGYALNLYPSNHWSRIAFEVKVSRSDFLSEIKNPNKRRPGLRFSNQFYFATPQGLVKPTEVPPECGLLEFSTVEPEIKRRVPWGRPVGTYAGSRVFSKYTVPAPRRDSDTPTWSLLASMTRQMQNQTVALYENNARPSMRAREALARYLDNYGEAATLRFLQAGVPTTLSVLARGEGHSFVWQAERWTPDMVDDAFKRREEKLAKQAAEEAHA